MHPSGHALFWQPSPVGAIGFAFKGDALWEVALNPWQACPKAPAPSSLHEGFALALDAYFAGNLAALEAFQTVPQRGTPFQQEVWRVLAQIAPCRPLSYAAVAAAVGRPKAFRAVGSAIGKNPLFLVLPCHRVLGSDGSLRGFACGLDVKGWLLQHEARFSG